MEVFDEVKSISSPLFQHLKPSSVFKKRRALMCRGYRKNCAPAPHRIPGVGAAESSGTFFAPTLLGGKKPLPADL